MSRFARPFHSWEMIVLRLVAYYWALTAAFSAGRVIKLALIGGY